MRIAIEWLGMTTGTPDPHPGESSEDFPEPSNPDWDSYSGEDEIATGNSDGPKMNIYCPDSLDLDDHDILFTFEGEDGNPVDFRCTASRFLSSVWREPEDRGTKVLILGKAVTKDEDAKWILGQVEPLSSSIVILAADASLHRTSSGQHLSDSIVPSLDSSPSRGRAPT